jgi:hypothetical protein
MVGTSEWFQAAVEIFCLLLSGGAFVLWFLYLSVRSDARAALAQAAQSKTELADYKLYALEHFVTQPNLTQAMDGINRAIEGLTNGIREMNTSFSSKLDSLHSRLDSKADKP